MAMQKAKQRRIAGRRQEFDTEGFIVGRHSCIGYDFFAFRHRVESDLVLGCLRARLVFEYMRRDSKVSRYLSLFCVWFLIQGGINILNLNTYYYILIYLFSPLEKKIKGNI